MIEVNTKSEKVYIGFDVSQEKIAVYGVYDENHSKNATIDNSKASIAHFLSMFKEPEKLCVVMETGTHSLWMSRFIESLGIEVIVAHARKLHLIYGGDKKNDALDARHLAELGRIDRDLLHPVKPMDKERQQDLVVVKARELLVRNRTSIINTIRGQLRSLGYSDKGFTVENMNKQADSLPEELKPLLTPLFQQLTYLSLGLKEYDRQIRELCKKYPDTKILRQIAGIGEITALAFVLRVGDATRFPTGERLSSFFGLVPKQDQSGEMDKQGKITKDGNNSMRRLLVQAANYIMGPFGPPCDLRDLGERIAARGGKIGKRKAKVAVARKLVTVLYAIWRNSAVPYDPHFKATRKKQKGIA